MNCPQSLTIVVRKGLRRAKFKDEIQRANVKAHVLPYALAEFAFASDGLRNTRDDVESLEKFIDETCAMDSNLSSLLVNRAINACKDVEEAKPKVISNEGRGGKPITLSMRALQCIDKFIEMISTVLTSRRGLIAVFLVCSTSLLLSEKITWEQIEIFAERALESALELDLPDGVEVPDEHLP